MTAEPDIRWLKWAQSLEAIAQNGLTYSENPFDIQRYEQIQHIAADMIAAQTHMQPSSVLDLFQQDVGYKTPKVDVRGAVFQAEQLLLVKELSDGGWTLPGGWVDVGESPSEAIVREVWEESGYKTRVVKLAAVYDRDHPRHGHPPFVHHVYKLFFICELLGGSPADNIETAAPTFFAETELPTLSLGRVVPSQIARLFEHYRQPALPTDYD
jgi:ADP-ribose pyrophosphatase YjhB (NUDIX family)